MKTSVSQVVFGLMYADLQLISRVAQPHDQWFILIDVQLIVLWQWGTAKLDISTKFFESS